MLGASPCLEALASGRALATATVNESKSLVPREKPKKAGVDRERCGAVHLLLADGGS